MELRGATHASVCHRGCYVLMTWRPERRRKCASMRRREAGARAGRGGGGGGGPGGAAGDSQRACRRDDLEPHPYFTDVFAQA